MVFKWKRHRLSACYVPAVMLGAGDSEERKCKHTVPHTVPGESITHAG